MLGHEDAELWTHSFFSLSLKIAVLVVSGGISKQKPSLLLSLLHEMTVPYPTAQKQQNNLCSMAQNTNFILTAVHPTQGKSEHWLAGHWLVEIALDECDLPGLASDILENLVVAFVCIIKVSFSGLVKISWTRI